MVIKAQVCVIQINSLMFFFSSVCFRFLSSPAYNNITWRHTLSCSPILYLSAYDGTINYILLCANLVIVFPILLHRYYNEVPLNSDYFLFQHGTIMPLPLHQSELFYSESIECRRERNMLFSSIVLDYRIKVDSQDTEQHYPLILCFGFK